MKAERSSMRASGEVNAICLTPLAPRKRWLERDFGLISRGPIEAIVNARRARTAHQPKRERSRRLPQLSRSAKA